jgi:hypothetical protein
VLIHHVLAGSETHAERERDLAAVCAALGKEVFSNAYDEGKKMTLDEK